MTIPEPVAWDGSADSVWLSHTENRTYWSAIYGASLSEVLSTCRRCRSTSLRFVGGHADSR